MKPSMEIAATIRDVQARHAYVFDNGLSSPDFFDLDKRMASEEFALLRKWCDREQAIIEIGSFTGLNLLGLAREGYRNVRGVEFVKRASRWMVEEATRLGLCWCWGFSVEFPKQFFRDHDGEEFDRIVCFDVLEHQQNVGEFLEGVSEILNPQGRALFLVPQGREFYDCGHVAFWPDAECLRNTLDYFFDVVECKPIETSAKLFAVCQRRD